MKRRDQGRLSARTPEAARTQVGAGPLDRKARLAAIQRVIAERAVGTQEELGQALRAQGFQVTQATLSRDLARLGAVRVARPGGGATYQLDSEELPYASERLREVGHLVQLVSDNESLCVVRTLPGSASTIARAIDLARLPQCLGTLAGDDTIFATPTRGTPSRKLTQALRTLLGHGATRRHTASHGARIIHHDNCSSPRRARRPRRIVVDGPG